MDSTAVAPKVKDGMFSESVEHLPKYGNKWKFFADLLLTKRKNNTTSTESYSREVEQEALTLVKDRKNV